MLTKLSVAAAVLLVAGCGTSRTAGPDAAPPTADGPTRDQVLMADGLCAAATALDTEVAEAAEIAEPAPGGYTGPSADFYLTFVDSDLEMLAAALEQLPESGVEAADRYVASFQAEVERIIPEVTGLVGDTWELTQLTEPQRVAIVVQVLELYESIDPEGPDLLTLARENRDFRAFYDLAPRCAPLEPPPPSSTPPTSTVPNVPPEDAEDGTDLAACADGDCEVAITGSATVTVGEYTIDVTVANDEVTTVEEFPGGGSGTTVMGGVGGASSFGVAGGETVTMTLNGLDGDTAVLEFSTD